METQCVSRGSQTRPAAAEPGTNPTEHRSPNRPKDGRAARLGDSSSGTNLVRAGDYNQRVVLQTIRRSGKTTRVELSRATGLTAPTIANITRRLAEAGLVRDVGRRRGSRGQPAKQLTVNPLGCAAIGLNIDRDHLTMLSLDLAGNVRSRISYETAFASPDQVAGFVAEALGPLLAEAGVERERVLGVGVALPDDLGRIAIPGMPEAYRRWADCSVAEVLHPVLPWPVMVDNDAAAAALGEAHCGGGLNLPSFFYILISAGLGGGLVLDRHYFEGADRRSAEIGLLPDPTSPVAGAIVQDSVSLSALFKRLALAGHEVTSIAGLEATTGPARRVIERWLDDAALALVGPLVSISCLINPHAVMVGGRLPPSLTQALVERLRSALGSTSLPAVAPIVRAEMADDAAAIGAAILPFLDQLLPSDAILMQAGREAA